MSILRLGEFSDNLSDARGAIIGVCGSCRDARGIKEAALADGTGCGSMKELADWTIEADKVLVF